MGSRQLAIAVIEQAYKDACSNYDNFNRKQARKFMCATSKVWEKSLRAWCEMAEFNADKIIRISRQMWGGVK